MTNLPPKNMTGAELWTELQQMPRPYRVVDFPRKGPDGKPLGQVAIWVLTPQEQVAAGIAAEKLVRQELKDKNDSLGYQTAYTNAASVELVLRACRDANDVTKPVFPTARAIREVCTVDEVAVLMEQYADVSAQLGPIISAMTQAEVDAWLERLIEGAASSL